MSAQPLKIEAAWDDEANVWYVESSDIPGLHIEARTQEEFLTVLQDVARELAAANLGPNASGRAADVRFRAATRHVALPAAE